MTTLTTHSMLNRPYRINALYELVDTDAATTGSSSSESGEPGPAAILRSTEGAERPAFGICRDTLALLKAVARHGCIPDFAYAAEQDGNRSISRLVLDGILELRADDGEYVSGPAALPVLFPDQLDLTGSGRLSRLSFEAVRYAGHLRSGSTAELAWKLYRYNTWPSDGHQAAVAADNAGVRRVLGIYAGSPASVQLKRNWVENSDTSKSPWFHWHSKRNRSPFDAHSPIYKMYVSPVPDMIADVIRVIASCGDSCPVAQFKAGADLQSLLRPDKIVLYFTSEAALRETHEHLARQLGPGTTQGVPFSSELSGDGLFSWGLDPPPGWRAPYQNEPVSWRYWAVANLAEYLQQAQADGIDPAEFAVRRLELEGVDIESWTPSPDIWEEPQTLGEEPCQ